MVQFPKPKKVFFFPFSDLIEQAHINFQFVCENGCEIMFGCHSLKQIYNDRRLFFGGGPGVVPSDSYGSVASSGQSSDRRSGRGRGMLFLVSFPPSMNCRQCDA